jgi:hypothetical protein
MASQPKRLVDNAAKRIAIRAQSKYTHTSKRLVVMSLSSQS